MACLMVILSVTLVPAWGIVGAAVAAAITNVGVNTWNLLEVRKALGISPYNRGYLRLVPPTIAALIVTLSVKRYSHVLNRDWLAVGVALGLAYCLFAAIVLMTGLDDDDRLIATAMWSRIRGAFVRTGVEA